MAGVRWGMGDRRLLRRPYGLLAMTVVVACIILVLWTMDHGPWTNSAYAQVTEEWMTKEGYFCTLNIRQDVDIERLNRKVDTYRVDFGLIEKPGRISQKPEHELLYKFDIIFLKVQEILDMRPKDIHLNVKIYPNKEDVEKLYIEILNRDGKFIAFYVFNLNTLYACEEKISVGVVAHEIAHCIVDHHFDMPPPKRIAEMIAHYAELQLRK